MRHPDYQWMVRLIQRNCPGAEWVKLHKVGTIRAAVRVRYGDVFETDQDIRDREAFLAGLHPDIWEVRLARVDKLGEIYEVIFSIPRQLSFA